ncbi:MAG: hypothetical protein ACRDNS_23630, partial [Trebonia sp.]
MTMRVSIEPGNDLVGRFGDTAVLISRASTPRDSATDASANELLGLVADLASDREAPATAVAARLAGWVLGHLAGEVPPFGIVVPVPDGVVVLLRGPVRCTVSTGGEVRNLSGEQALTWVDQILPGTFEWLAIGKAEGPGVQPDPVSDLRDGVVPGQGFVIDHSGGHGMAAVDAESAVDAAPARRDPVGADAEPAYAGSAAAELPGQDEWDEPG